MLLQLNGHSQHVKNLEIIELGRQHGVYIVVIPLHTSHKLQSLDVAFMKPLSDYYSTEVSNFQRTGQLVQIKDIFLLIGIHKSS